MCIVCMYTNIINNRTLQIQPPGYWVGYIRLIPDIMTNILKCKSELSDFWHVGYLDVEWLKNSGTDDQHIYNFLQPQISLSNYFSRLLSWICIKHDLLVLHCLLLGCGSCASMVGPISLPTQNESA